MEIINLTDAKVQFSAVVDRVVQGEEIIIARQGKPVAVISAYQGGAAASGRTGFLNGKIRLAKDFDQWPEDLAQAFGITE